jgi:hypothetical protein
VFNPDERHGVIEDHVSDFSERHQETTDRVFIRRQIEEQLDSLKLEPFEVDKELHDALLQRLNPFRYNKERAIESISKQEAQALAFLSQL